MSSKYFLNLLNRRTDADVKSLLIDGEECTDSAMIESEIRSFYKDLYETSENRNINPNFFRNVEPLEAAAADDVVKPLTLEDLTETLQVLF